MKRTIFLAATLALALVMAISGTVAYLSDTDEDVNVMVLGNVEIDQVEYRRVVENGTWVSTGETDKYGYTPDKLEAYANDGTLYPAFFADGTIKWDGRTGFDGEDDPRAHQQSWAQVGASGSNQLFDDSVKGAIDKFVFVKNTGKSDAYVRTWIALEQGSVAADNFKNVIMTNTDKDHWSWEVAGTDVEIKGNEYYVLCATYLGPTSNPTGILAPGAVSYPSLLQVYMKPEATNDDVKAIDGNGDGLYNILVLSQAVQTNNFTSADQALTAAFGSDHPWKKDNDYNVTGTNVANADELIEALEAGDHVALTGDVKIDPAGMSNAYGTTGINIKNGQTIDGNGHTLDIKGAGGTWDSGINTTGGLIKDLTVTGSFRGIFINHNSDFSEPVILDGVTIDGTTYTISCDQGKYQDLIAKDSTFKGWTSYAATLGNASFTNCYFGEGNGYAYMRPYCPTTFVGCKFEAGYTVEPRAAVTFENCTLGGVALTSANIEDLVTSTANVTVK